MVSMADLCELARFFRALGDGTRLGLVQLLARQQPGRMLCVGRLAEELGVSASAVSQHLRVLKDLGLVRRERRSHRIHYFLDPDGLAAYRQQARDVLGDTLVFGNTLHDQEVTEMSCCEGKGGCEHPEKRHGAACSPDQIQACHGDADSHPCECTPEHIRECHGDVQEHPCESAR
jgi:DNA-binding transcriptional ArsR family regulator